MKKQVFFGFLFFSWILCVSLICLFPPVPDYQEQRQDSGYLSQDTSPEFHIRNTIQSEFSHSELGMGWVGLDPEIHFLSDFTLLFSIESSKAPYQLSSFFDSRILFRAFFETW